MRNAFLRAFAYPLRGNNLWVLVASVAAYVLPQILAWLFPISGWVAACFQAALVLYFALFLQSILESSMAGKDSFPAWPEHPSSLAYLESVFGILGPYVVSFLPLIALRCIYADFGNLGRKGFGVVTLFLSGPIPQAVPNSPAWFEPISWVLATVGMAYLPMALLIWSFFGGNAVLNPFIVIQNALRAARSYLVTVVLVSGLLLAWWGASALVLPQIPFSWARGLLEAFSLAYALCVSMRLIGLHYFLNRETLQWERTR
ncbi:MAG TPA: hypothetical protein VFS19_01480 [Planctomycetota bacterium]|nr:hypothetical protein [Planctomycetota bacterium]